MSTTTARTLAPVPKPFFPFILALASFFLWWLALPRTGLWGLVFFVPSTWSFLFQTPVSGKKERFSFYAGLIFSTFCFWLLVNYWLIFPHPATSLGWIALSLYLSLFFPLFIALTRELQSAIIRLSPSSMERPELRFPLETLLPAITWIAVEWLRKHLLGGYSFASLEHTLYNKPLLIQTADLCGEYTVSFFIVLVGLSLGLLIQSFGNKKDLGLKKLRFRTILFTLGLFMAVLGYGQYRLQSIRAKISDRDTKTPPLRIALLQDPTVFRFPVPEETNEQIHRSYMALTREAAQSDSKPDLIVWPESCFLEPHFDILENGFFPGMENLSPDDRAEKVRVLLAEKGAQRSAWLAQIGVPVILGTCSVLFDDQARPRYYNSALFLRSGEPILRYDKINRVMFGEYLPFGDYLPESFPLKTLCVSIRAGREPVIFPLVHSGQLSRILVNICFESSTPHLFTRLLDKLARQEKEPSILINISNDGWFRHTSQIDLHLATEVFRAVENRKWFLTATHGGISAVMDPTGTIRAQGDRYGRQVVTTLVEPVELTRSGPILRLIPLGCLFFVILMEAVIRVRIRKKNSLPPQKTEREED